MTEELNRLKNRDKASIDKIESCFREGPLASAMAVAPQIERRQLSEDEFVRQYRREGRPVILEGLLEHWPARHKWSFEYLAARCANARVVVDSYHSKRARDVRFAEFVDMLKSPRNASGEPIYLQEWYYQTNCPFLADDLPDLAIAAYDFRRNLYGNEISTNHQLWIGQQGATTRLHQDSYFIDVLHAQIVGTKRWYVMGPDACLAFDAAGQWDFERLAADTHAQMMQCILKPGDVLYLPAQWWHRIELLTDSIGLGRKCLDEINLQQHIKMRFAEVLALALNRDEVEATHPELFNVVLARNRAWAKRMNIDLSKLRP